MVAVVEGGGGGGGWGGFGVVGAPDGSPTEGPRARASQLSAFGSDCRRARCPTVRRSLADTHPEFQSRREPQTRTEEKRGHEPCAEEGFCFSV